MQYVVAMRSLVRNLNRKNEDGSPKVVIRTHYIPAVSRAHAHRIQAALDGADGMSTNQDGPFLIENSYEVCCAIRTADGRRMYIDQSELEYLVSEYTAPQQVAAE